jgi:hypothetical protein
MKHDEPIKRYDFSRVGKSEKERNRVCAPARRFFNESMKPKLHSLFTGLALLAGVHEAADLPATNTPAATPVAPNRRQGQRELPGRRVLAVTRNGEATPEGLVGATPNCGPRPLRGESSFTFPVTLRRQVREAWRALLCPLS